MNATAEMPQSPTTRPFIEKHLYQGKVKAQSVTYGKDDVPQLVVTIGLDGKLIDQRNPTNGVIPCPAIDVEVKLQFQADDEQRLGYVLSDLERLGFTGDDIEVLNPEVGGKKHHSFVGQTVFVAPTYKVLNDKEQTYWNFRFPKRFEDRPVPKGALSKSPAAAKYKELLQQKREAALATGGGTNGVPF